MSRNEFLRQNNCVTCQVWLMKELRGLGSPGRPACAHPLPTPVSKDLEGNNSWAFDCWALGSQSVMEKKDKRSLS